MILHSIERISNIRECFETAKFNSLAGKYLFHRTSLVVDKEADFPLMYTTDKDIFLPQSTLLNKYCRSDLRGFIIEV